MDAQVVHALDRERRRNRKIDQEPEAGSRYAPPAMKAPTSDTLERIAAALAWAEAHLDRRITVADVARRALYSPFHFHRMVSGLTGVPLMELLRRRRLTIAAEALRDADRPILEIALDAGFDSQEAFTRAFKVFGGATPGRYRRDPAAGTVVPTPPLDLLPLEPPGDRTMEPKFLDLPALDLVGLAGRFVVGETEGIPALWMRFVQAWQDAGRPFPRVSYGVCYDESAGSEGEAVPFTYLAAFELEGEPPEGLEVRSVPANRYAVFTHHGPVAAIGETYGWIFGTWLPTSGYRRPDGPDFERYDERFDDEALTGEVDIYVPVAEA